MVWVTDSREHHPWRQPLIHHPLCNSLPQAWKASCEYQAGLCPPPQCSSRSFNLLITSLHHCLSIWLSLPGLVAHLSSLTLDPMISKILSTFKICGKASPWLLDKIRSKYYLSSVQSLSRVRLFATPWTTARQASLSITNSQSLPKPMSIESVMPSNHLILCLPFSSCPQSFPASGSFPMSQLFTSSDQSIGVSVSASVLPMNSQCTDCFTPKNKHFLNIHLKNHLCGFPGGSM